MVDFHFRPNSKRVKWCYLIIGYLRDHLIEEKKFCLVKIYEFIIVS